MSESALATGASAAAIQHHYDVSNEFYALWLDPSLTYSGALWYGDEDLSTAQRNKLDWHLEHCRDIRTDRLLDVGCGWGSLLRAATERHGVAHAVGLTLSAAQASSIEAQKLPKVEVRLESWADHVVEEPYGGIVSIGAFEHFARLDQTPTEKLAGYRAFFEFCHRALKPGGWLSLQSIVYENSDQQDFSRFFAERIFPESDLPHVSEITKAIERLFEIEVLRNDRHHYARTLRHWLANLRARRTEAVAVVGEETFATYEKYLALMVVAFHTGAMNLSRIRMRRIDRSRAS